MYVKSRSKKVFIRCRPHSNLLLCRALYATFHRQQAVLLLRQATSKSAGIFLKVKEYLQLENVFMKHYAPNWNLAFKM